MRLFGCRDRGCASGRCALGSVHTDIKITRAIVLAIKQLLVAFDLGKASGSDGVCRCKANEILSILVLL